MQILSNAKCKIISVDNNFSLAALVAKKLGITKVNILSSKFSNQEISVILNESVRGADVFMFINSQSSCNESLMELLITVSTCKLCSAQRITAVLPYLPYSSPENIINNMTSTHLIANLLRIAGVSQIITLNLEIGAICSIFNMPLENLRVDKLICSWIKENLLDYKNSCFISLQKIAFDRANGLANELDSSFAVFHETFRKNTTTSGTSDGEKNKTMYEYEIIGCIKNKMAILVEGIATDCEFLCSVAEKLLKMGAKVVYAVCIHGMFTKSGLDRLTNSQLISVITTNSFCQIENMKKHPKLKCIDVSDLFALAIERVHNSISGETVFCDGDSTATQEGHIYQSNKQEN